MKRPDNIFKPFGQYLRKKRVAQNLTQMEVAEMFGYSSPQFISNWERGESAPPEEILPSLVVAYRIKPKELSKFLLKIHKVHLEELLSA